MRLGLLGCWAAGLLGSAVPLSAQSSHVLIITGTGGEPAYSQRFHEWATKLADAAITKHSVPAANVLYLSEAPDKGGRLDGKSDKATVERAFATLAQKSQPGDAILIVLIGHGSAEGGEPRFNLPGPDLTAKDYARLLGQLEGRRVALVNAASASGAFLDALSLRGRTVVTATRSGQERNETIFAKFFVDAYAGSSSDMDKDGKVSLLEAYTYAAKETERWYKEQNRLLTEHAVLDDDGDGKGTALPDGRGEGASARTFVLANVVAANASPELRAALQQRAALEEKIATLRSMKARMEAATYEKDLEKLLLELAELNQQIKKLEGRK